eukprot:gnl/Dysnectes_brevis/1694_a1926_2027.p1 GENE.gnl/Dysnectes_brevis/1694_a1926_2027~~gnl/Dysnectes_brevis/1694_a1926_2027.p1  ORF type:complete len:497 (-),score=134.63 gnl/Dysnectes_brevis/1694_a1926_2027:162-1652(-)
MHIILVAFTFICLVRAWTTDPLPIPQDPGISLAFTQTGIDKYMNFFLDIIADEAAKVVISDIEGSADLGITQITFSFTSIELKEITIIDADILLQEGQVSIELDDVSVSLLFNWEYTEDAWPYISDSGYGQADITDATLIAVASAFINETTQLLSIDLTSFDLSVGDIDITLYGGASWLYDLIISLLEELIEDYLIDPLAYLVKDSIQSMLDDAFNGNIRHIMDRPVMQDQRFCDAPLQHTDYFVMMVYGQVIPDEDSGYPVTPWYRGPPKPFQPKSVADSDITMVVDIAVVNQNYDVHFYSKGLYAYSVSPGTMPPEYAPFLQEDFLATLAPGIASLFVQGDEEVALTVNATSPPLATCYPTALYVSTPVNLTLTVGGQHALTLGTTYGTSSVPVLTVDAHDWGNSTCIDYSHELYNVTAPVLVDSSVGDVDITSQDLFALLGLLGAESLAPWLSSISVNTKWCYESQFLSVDDYSIVYGDTYLALDITIHPTEW